MDEEKSTSGLKVYSPDLQAFSLEGRSGVFGTLASLIVGPIRVISRVAHNVMILPADLLASYAEGLMITGVVFGAIGIVDYVVYRKWPLLISQVPVILAALHFKAKARKAITIAETKHEVEIDSEQVEQLCATIYDELDSIVGNSEEG